MTVSPSPGAPRYSRITGTGSHLPPRRVSNADLARELAARGIETSDEWIVERTGIRARHFAADGVACSDLALVAARAALQAAGRQAADIDLIIVATSTPDMVFPSTACILQDKLGVHGCPAFDVQAVCSGFVYALTLADSLIRTGSAARALVIGAEVFSRILDFDDRTTCVLFGDGAGAVVLEASDEPGLLASELHADGRHVGILCVPGTVAGGKVLGDPTSEDGRAGGLQAGRRRARRRGPRGAGQGRQDRGGHRLPDPAPGQHPHHAKHGQEAEAGGRQADRHRRRTWQHLGRIDSAGARCSGARRAHPPRSHVCCSRGWAAASPGAQCCSSTEAGVPR